jgi:thymidylate synthase (FAD)
MHVALITHTPDPEAVCAYAARMCYSAGMPEAIVHGTTTDSDILLLRKVLGMGHESVTEHANFTFGIGGISRACSHQLVRHRVASYSQQSQRYVGQVPSIIMPDTIRSNPAAAARFQKAITEAVMAYRDFTDMGIPAEDARFVLPNAAETKLVLTMNARELRHFFALRCCEQAQWEIREMANLMLNACRRIAPALFADAGPGCTRGACPEGGRGCHP